MMRRFADRRSAGASLGAEVARSVAPGAVVFGLPRGGVPVAAEVALAVDGDLDALIVRKLGAPGRPELAIGAIATGGVRVLNTDIVHHLGVSDAEIDRIVERARRELDRRDRLYRGDRPVEVAGREVVVVDDGAATGATMVVALRAVREMAPARVTAAVPVASVEAAARLRAAADDVVVIAVPEPFHAVGAWYLDFDQTGDDEVIELLRAANDA